MADLKNINEEVFKKYLRVLKLARTPTRDEFNKIAIVAAIGILIVGMIGFILYEIMALAL
ncbi:MAG TPA: protein translocase SEC61 complex subunit gamma [Methanoculleus sp.]|nr:protein translocase SEC61 complex subunit gamma [Methanoculleus sp.]